MVVSFFAVCERAELTFGGKGWFGGWHPVRLMDSKAGIKKQISRMVIFIKLKPV
jgi:hypothetical protein